MIDDDGSPKPTGIVAQVGIVGCFFPSDSPLGTPLILVTRDGERYVPLWRKVEALFAAMQQIGATFRFVHKVTDARGFADAIRSVDGEADIMLDYRVEDGRVQFFSAHLDDWVAVPKRSSGGRLT